tara:strand:- start:156 stop:485 length:330 start_codon:yes stop_codon:yes gene_type:complete
MITINETLSKLNQWDVQLEHYQTNADNLHYWAKEIKACKKHQAPTQLQIINTKVTDEECDAVHEYHQNYTDYEKIVSRLNEIITRNIKTAEAEHGITIAYDGCSYRVKK